MKFTILTPDAQYPDDAVVERQVAGKDVEFLIHRSRDLLVRQRTAAVNALRGHLAEFGFTAAKGTARARELMSLVNTDERVPAIARDALLQLVDQIRDTERKIEAFDKQILSLAPENEVCRRLMTVLTIGPFAATALAATWAILTISPQIATLQPG